jgi:hypothetical protein
MTTLLIALLFVGILNLMLTGFLLYGVAKMRSDFEFWQNITRTLLRRYWHDRPHGPKLDDALADWLKENPDRPRKDDPPFVK